MAPTMIWKTKRLLIDNRKADEKAALGTLQLNSRFLKSYAKDCGRMLGSESYYRTKDAFKKNYDRIKYIRADIAKHKYQLKHVLECDWTTLCRSSLLS